MNTLPPLFLDQMAAQLGAEFGEFAASFDQPPNAGLRLNPIKIDRETFLRRFPLTLSPVAWCPDGFLLPQATEFRAGKHPYHTAGLYYLQDPAAMAAVEILTPKPGEILLDLAAAPGGKATHLASAIQNRGFLVANEIHPRRAWDLAENLERWGATHTAITSVAVEQLAEQLPAQFDRVLLDAPCSGEALFRRNLDARGEWSPEVVLACARRQENLIDHAARLVKPGGYLLYATCTFNTAENEAVIEKFLGEHPEFRLATPPGLPGLSAGNHPRLVGEQAAHLPGSDQELGPVQNGDLSSTRRIWPHRAAGEGHFFALLHKIGNGDDPPNPRRSSLNPRGLPKMLSEHFKQFWAATLITDHPPGYLHLEGSYLYNIQEGCPPLSGLRVIHPGLWLGVFKTSRFEPAHALALTLKPEQVQRACRLDPEDARLRQYLRGEAIQSPGEAGWVLVCVEDFPLGWGKRVGNRVKSHFPRGLRWT